MIDVSYQKIIDIIVPTIPENWEKVVCRIMYFGDSCEIKYYVKDNSGYRDSFALNLDNQVIIDTILMVEKEVRKVRENLSGDELWSLATIVFRSDGYFWADFNYEVDILENTDAMRAWKMKYLT